MPGVERERTAAWAELLKEAAAPSPAERAAIVELRQKLQERAQRAQSECGRGRAQLAELTRLLERGDQLKLELAREWVHCVDEVLALAERACSLVGAPQP